LGASFSFHSKSRHRKECLNHFGYNYLTQTFDSENGRKILDKCDEKTEEKYKDVLNGKRRTLITSPPHFVYSSKLNPNFSVMESELENKVLNEENEDKAELKDILAFRKIYLPQAGERDIFNPLIGSFFHYPGIFVNGFKPNQYLKEFHRAAEEMRNTEFGRKANSKVTSWMPLVAELFPKSGSKYVNKIKGSIILKELIDILGKESSRGNMWNEVKKRFKESGDYTEEEVENHLISALKSCSYYEINRMEYEFNEMEVKLLECNGTSENEITKLADKILAGLKVQKLESMVEGKAVMKSIEKLDLPMAGKRLNNFLKTTNAYFLASHERKAPSKQEETSNAMKLKPKSHLLGDVRSSLKQILYEEFVKPPGEWDFLIILNHLKIMINVEVKQQMDLKDRETHNLNGSLKSASHQCEEHSDYAARVFAPFLSDGWQFIKIAAILPGKLDDSTICKHCNEFIITGNNEKEISMKINNIKDRLLSKSGRTDSKEAQEDLTALTKILVGLSSLSTEHPDCSSAWRQIQGSEKDRVSLSGGWTKSESEIAPNEMTFKKILTQPHNIYKLVYYNVDQQHILSNRLTLVVLKGDFGAGTKYFQIFITRNILMTFI